MSSPHVILLETTPTVMVSWFGPENQGWWFGDLGLKITTTIFCLGLKTKRRRFVGLHIKIDEWMKTVWGHASTSSGSLHHNASQARVSQFYLKTSQRVTAGDAHGIIVKVAWKWSKRRSVRWRRVWRIGSWTKLQFIRWNFHFIP
jgi:hypothetical protein